MTPDEGKLKTIRPLYGKEALEKQLELYESREQELFRLLAVSEFSQAQLAIKHKDRELQKLRELNTELCRFIIEELPYSARKKARNNPKIQEHFTTKPKEG